MGWHSHPDPFLPLVCSQGAHLSPCEDRSEREVPRSDENTGWGEQNTGSFLSLACEPTHKQGFLFFKRVPASLGLRSRSVQREKGRPWHAGSAGGGRGGQPGHSPIVGLDWMLPVIRFLLINPHSWRRNIYVGSHRGNPQTGKKREESLS